MDNNILNAESKRSRDSNTHNSPFLHEYMPHSNISMRRKEKLT